MVLSKTRDMSVQVKVDLKMTTFSVSHWVRNGLWKWFSLHVVESSNADTDKSQTHMNQRT